MALLRNQASMLKTYKHTAGVVRPKRVTPIRQSLHYFPPGKKKAEMLLQENTVLHP